MYTFTVYAFLNFLKQTSFITIFVVMAGILLSCNLQNVKGAHAPFNEVTFMEICWRGDVAEYSSKTNPIGCKVPLEDIVWPVLPLRVKAYYNDQAFVKALGLWNQLVGKKVFVLSDTGVDVAMGTSTKHPPGKTIASVRHLRDHGHLIALVTVYRPILQIKTDRRIRVYFHELGHVLGLEHDKFDRRSIMHPSSDGTVLKAADLKAIQKRYANK